MLDVQMYDRPGHTVVRISHVKSGRARWTYGLDNRGAG
jgi:hypothetical protein